MVEQEKRFVSWHRVARDLGVGTSTLVRATREVGIYPPLYEEKGLLARSEVARLESLVDVYKDLPKLRDTASKET